MYHKEFNIGNKKFVFMFTHKPYYTDENTIIMGFPFNIDAKTFDETKIDNAKGYYIYIKLKDDSVTVINDIMGNYRTYYIEKDGVTYFSNDFLYLFNLLPKEEREPNKFELEYWDKHRYTTGGETLCTRIHKIKPAHIYKFYSDKIEEKLYFKDIENKPNRKKHFEEVLADLRDTVSLIKKMPQKKFLLFSGGADSTLCVKLLQEQGVEFTPVFAKHIPTNSMNYDDILKVKCSAELLGIEPVEIEIDTTQKLDENIINTTFTDRSITQLFFVIARKLKEKYGEDVILMNGQAADNIFNFGPTNETIGQNMTRSMLFTPFHPRNIIFYNVIFKVVRPIFKKYRLTKNIKEYLTAFLDDMHYIPLLDISKNKSYYEYISSIVEKINESLNNKYSILMYLKIYSYLQGSDDYVNVQNSECYGFKSLFLYATANIIYSTVRNTDYKYEICHPKSVVYKILKDVFNYTMPDIKKKKNYKKEIKQEKTFSDYENEIYQIFYNKINSLEFSEKINVRGKFL